MSRKTKEIEIKDGDYVIVNPNTGEFIDTYGEGDRIVHKEQDEYAQKYIINFNKGEPFVKLYDKAVDILRRKLSATEFMLAISLEKFVSYKDSILRHNGKIMNMQDIATELDLDYGTVRRQVSSLTKKGVLGIHKTGCVDNPKIMVKAITCNPYIYLRGNDINKMSVALFEKSGWDKLLN